MLNTDYIKTIHGIVSIAQIVLGLIAIIIGTIIWPDGSVYILIYPSYASGVVFVLFALIVTWTVTLGVTAMQVMGKGVLETMGKLKLIIYHGVILVVLLIAAGLESYYATRGHSYWTNYDYSTRVILDTFILWFLVVSHIGQLVFVVLQ